MATTSIFSPNLALAPSNNAINSALDGGCSGTTGKRKRQYGKADPVEWMAPFEQDKDGEIAFRIRATHLLFSVVRNMTQSRLIEEAIYFASLSNSIMYTQKLTQIAHAIGLNPSLVKQYAYHVLVLLDDTLLSVGTPVETWWDEYAQKLSYQRMVLSEREVYEQIELTHTDTSNAVLVCFKCHSKSIETEQKQTRGADEAMTVFCKCRNCETRWRM
jgi:hypothetical protein